MWFIKDALENVFPPQGTQMHSLNAQQVCCYLVCSINNMVGGMMHSHNACQGLFPVKYLCIILEEISRYK